MNKLINFLNFFFGTVFHLPSTIILLLVVIYRIIRFYFKTKPQDIEVASKTAVQIADEVLVEAKVFRETFDWFFWVIILIITTC